MTSKVLSYRRQSRRVDEGPSEGESIKFRGQMTGRLRRGGAWLVRRGEGRVPLPEGGGQLAVDDLVRGLKSVLHFCCEKSLGQLRPNHANFIGSFRLPTKDKYGAVRGGTVFLSMQEESQIVDYFDEINAKVRSSKESVTLKERRAGSVLLTSYQHAFRPHRATSC
jgi:hypothetical protein